jgi:cardiolipin synthase
MDDFLPSLGTSYVLLEWTIRILMLVVVPMRRAAAATRSWLLLIFFLPIPGLLLYLAIGRPRFPAWRIARLKQLAPVIAALSDRLAVAAAPVLPRSGDPLTRRLGALPPVGGNRVDFLDDYRGTIARLVADIDGARDHVRLLVYIFADDATGRSVIAALARAVARGVACHVLLDPVGSHRWAKGTIAQLQAAGVEIRQTLPFRWLRGRTRRDMRNHRKLFLIDGRIGYAGSQNIVDPDFRPGILNHELVLRVEGPAVAEMAAIFLIDWYLETEHLLDEAPAIPAAAGTAIAQVLPSGADYPLQGFETLLVWHIHAAQSAVTVTTPISSPTRRCSARCGPRCCVG